MGAKRLTFLVVIALLVVIFVLFGVRKTIERIEFLEGRMAAVCADNYIRDRELNYISGRLKQHGLYYTRIDSVIAERYRNGTIDSMVVRIPGSERGNVRVGSLRVFVWEDVLESYSFGMVVVVAENVSRAREMVAKELDWVDMGQFDKEPEELGLKEDIFYVHGGD